MGLDLVLAGLKIGKDVIDSSSSNAAADEAEKQLQAKQADERKLLNEAQEELKQEQAQPAMIQERNQQESFLNDLRKTNPLYSISPNGGLKK